MIELHSCADARSWNDKRCYCVVLASQDDANTLWEYGFGMYVKPDAFCFLTRYIGLKNGAMRALMEIANRIDFKNEDARGDWFASIARRQNASTGPLLFRS